MIKILTFKDFLEGFEVLKTRFEFRTDVFYTQLVYNTLRTNISLETFNKALSNLIKQNKEDWQQRYNCKYRLDLADLIIAFISENFSKQSYDELKIIKDQLKLFEKHERADLSSSTQVLFKKKI
jgi:hypothetical protein